MSDLVQRLNRSLVGRYEVQREIGRGGMATVFLVRDLKHERKVAIKVLHPDLAASIGAERFLREIRISAQLQHPHVLTLIDSGEASGLLYYVLPYVEGESLRERLEREGQLPIDDAVLIAREVADALEYAHGLGIIHRDIKPANILFKAGHAVVADFGVARAVTEAGEEKLTESGIAIGTVHYMSPEQGLGEQIDARSDVYSLGCVLYEMLAGEPPFTGPTRQAILARHSLDPVPRLATVRGKVPEHLVVAIDQALAKSPADRFSSAAELRDCLRTAALAKRGKRAVSWRTSAVAVGTLSMAAIAWLMLRPSATPPTAESDTVAVFPFPVTAPDTALDWLAGEGMVYMLEPVFDGTSGPRSADPAVVMREWERLRQGGSDLVPVEDLRLAAGRLGYGLVVTGSIVGTASEVRLGARLRRVSDGLLIAEVETRGPGDPDSVVRMVDDLGAQLVGVEAGQPLDRARSLMGSSAAARRAYLEGQRALRRFANDEAVLAFELALQRDSTFALAALGLNSALIWARSPANLDYDEALELAWKNRDRLPPVDLAIVQARGGGAGSRHLSRQSDELAAWQRLVQLAPDRFDAWFGLADDLFHHGAVLGVERPLERAWQAFVKAFEADSTLAEWQQRRGDLLNHMVDFTLFRRDTAALRRYLPLYLQSDAGGKYAHELVARKLLGDDAQHDSLTQLMSSHLNTLWIVVAEASEFSFAVDDADRAALLLAQDSQGYEELWRYSLNRGRPAAAARFLDLAGLPDHFRIRDALFGDGDRVAAAEAAARISAAVDSGPPEPSETNPERGVYQSNLCALVQWRLARGDITGAEAAIQTLRSVTQPIDSAWQVAQAQACAEALEAWLAVEVESERAIELVRRLDVTLRTSPRLTAGRLESLNFANSWMWERLGDPKLALAAIRRRSIGLGAHYRAAMLQEEGRLAALVGDRDGAIAAYRKYLELLSDPESVMAGKVDAVRDELARLGTDPPAIR